MTIILYFLIVLLGAVVQSVTGFGFGIFVVSLLPLLLPLQQTVAILVVLSIVMNFQLAWKLRAHVEWKTMLPTLLSGILFQSLCVPLLFLVDAGILRRILGAVLIGFALFFAFVKERIRLKKSPANAVIAGGLTGLFNTFNIGGPPTVLYYFYVCQDNEAYLATTQMTFLISSVCNCASHLAYGNLNASVFLYAALGVAAVLPGTYLGYRIFQRLNKEILGKAIYLLIGAMGLLQLLTAG